MARKPALNAVTASLGKGPASLGRFCFLEDCDGPRVCEWQGRLKGTCGQQVGQVEVMMKAGSSSLRYCKYCGRPMQGLVCHAVDHHGSYPVETTNRVLVDLIRLRYKLLRVYEPVVVGTRPDNIRVRTGNVDGVWNIRRQVLQDVLPVINGMINTLTLDSTNRATSSEDRQ